MQVMTYLRIGFCKVGVVAIAAYHVHKGAAEGTLALGDHNTIITLVR